MIDQAGRISARVVSGNLACVFEFHVGRGASHGPLS